MQEPTFLILTALAAGAQHGYGIMSDVARISDGRVRLRAGTLYAALDRLKADGLVTGDKEEIVDGRLRRYYRITDEGTAELAAEVGRLRANAAVAASRLGLGSRPLGAARVRAKWLAAGRFSLFSGTATHARSGKIIAERAGLSARPKAGADHA
jgi:DNA-binding PadR family transcriptional regulator